MPEKIQLPSSDSDNADVGSKLPGSITIETTLPSTDAESGNRLPSSDSEKSLPGSNESGDDNIGDSSPPQTLNSLNERLRYYTLNSGLKDIPEQYNSLITNDWKLINSENPFEILYCDYLVYDHITDEVVKNNYGYLRKFWEEKQQSFRQGASSMKSTLEKRYGKDTLDTCLSKLEAAFDKLSKPDGIKKEFGILDQGRIQTGIKNMLPLMDGALMDGKLELIETRSVLDRSQEFNINEVEAGSALFDLLQTKKFKPIDEPKGDTIPEKLLSTIWASEKEWNEIIEQRKKIQESGIKIFDQSAHSIEEIGQILFTQPDKAKKYIQEDVLKGAVSAIDADLAIEIADIKAKDKNLDRAFLEIVYRLDPKLPYRFKDGVLADIPEKLASLMFENEETLKLGKEQFSKAYIKIWLQATNKQLYVKHDEIERTAPNQDLAFLELLYTFNPNLPYRLNQKREVKTPEELVSVIDESSENWNAGKAELYNGSITTWMATTGHSEISGNWEKMKVEKSYKKASDVGLESFLHIVKPDLPAPFILTNYQQINLPKIQSGSSEDVIIEFTHERRGYIEASLELTKLPGVNLTHQSLQFSNLFGTDKATAKLTINSDELLRGKEYQTEIKMLTSTSQEITIPIKFQIVFPKQAFWLTVITYATIFGLIMGGLRYIISASIGGDWLQNIRPYFITWNNVSSNFWSFLGFGGLFLFIVTSIFLAFRFPFVFPFKRKSKG